MPSPLQLVRIHQQHWHYVGCAGSHCQAFTHTLHGSTHHHKHLVWVALKISTHFDFPKIQSMIVYAVFCDNLTASFGGICMISYELLPVKLLR